MKEAPSSKGSYSEDNPFGMLLQHSENLKIQADLLRNHSYSKLLKRKTQDNELRQAVKEKLVKLLATVQLEHKDVGPWLDVFQERMLQGHALQTLGVYTILEGYLRASFSTGKPSLPKPGDIEGWDRMLDTCYEDFLVRRMDGEMAEVLGDDVRRGERKCMQQLVDTTAREGAGDPNDPAHRDRRGLVSLYTSLQKEFGVVHIKEPAEPGAGPTPKTEPAPVQTIDF